MLNSARHKIKFCADLFVVRMVTSVWRIIKKQKILVQEIDTVKYTGHDIFDNLENQNFLHVTLYGAYNSDIHESNFIVICVFLVCWVAYCWDWQQQWYLRELWSVFLLPFLFFSLFFFF